jgi:succinoglycan biosynthesis protein ExoU
MIVNEQPVAVIIAAWNAQETIRRAVTSALEQEFVGEVIVVDDASKDDTRGAALSADDGSGRLHVVSLRENGGPSRARNVALNHSQAHYVCILDADDYFLPGRIANLLGAEIGDWDILADDIVIVPEQAHHVPFSVAQSDEQPGALVLDLATFVTGNISRAKRLRGELGFLKPIIKREFLQKHSLRYDETLCLGEDYALYTQALIAGARFCVVGACGYVAIQRTGSISGRHAASDLERMARFDEQCLASAAKLSASERAALVAHQTATLRKCHYREVLDRKKARGLLPALAMLASRPSSVPFILGETITAKAGAVRNALGLAPADPNSYQIRLLLGLRQSRLSVTAPAAAKPVFKA